MQFVLDSFVNFCFSDGRPIQVSGNAEWIGRRGLPEYAQADQLTNSGHGTMVDFTVRIAIASATA
jgi:hypothetical protein